MSFPKHAIGTRMVKFRNHLNQIYAKNVAKYSFGIELICFGFQYADIDIDQLSLWKLRLNMIEAPLL